MTQLQYFDGGALGRVLIHTVAEGHRLRLPVETAELVPWLKMIPRKVTMLLGKHGGVQLWHTSIPIPGDEMIDEIRAALSNLPPKASESSSDWMPIVRSGLLRCDTEFRSDGHYSVGLPKLFRNMDVLPNEGELAAILISGEIFEIWRAEKLAEHAREAKSRFSRQIELAIQQLQTR